MRTEVTVRGVSGRDVTDFLIRCTDDDYQEWWPGVHLVFHTTKRCPNEIGNLVYFDEYVGKRRLKCRGVVTEYDPGKKIMWQMKKGVKLPSWVILECEESGIGVRIVHSLAVGFGGLGRVLDPILRIFFTERFERELNEHARVEFHRLADMLS